jgi:hypothetical protein
VQRKQANANKETLTSNPLSPNPNTDTNARPSASSALSGSGTSSGSHSGDIRKSTDDNMTVGSGTFYSHHNKNRSLLPPKTRIKENNGSDSNFVIEMMQPPAPPLIVESLTDSAVARTDSVDAGCDVSNTRNIVASIVAGIAVPSASSTAGDDSEPAEALPPPAPTGEATPASHVAPVAPNESQMRADEPQT